MGSGPTTVRHGLDQRVSARYLSVLDPKLIKQFRELARHGEMQRTDRQGVFYLNQAMPFGGVKASGHGRFGKFHPSLGTRISLVSLTSTGGEEGLRSLCAPKSVIHDRLFSLIRTPIPKLVGESFGGSTM